MAESIMLETGHWGAREYLALLGGGRRGGDAVAELAAAARAELGGKAAYPLNSGRGAFALALSLLAKRAPHRRRVVIPDYVCPAIPETIRALGLEPFASAVGADLNLDTDAVLPLLDEKALAVVPVHMYGKFVSLAKIADAARAAGVGLIDNAAHVIGTGSAAGAIPGTCGTFGIVSFAQSKSIVCGYSGAGGLLIVNNPSDEAEVSALFRELSPSGDAQARRYLLWGRRIHPGPDRLWRLRKGHGRTRPSFQAAKISQVHAAIALGQFRSLKPRINDKIRVAECYRHELDGASSISFPQFAPGRYLTRIMLRAASLEARNSIRSRLSQKGIATRRGYPPLDCTLADGAEPRELPLLEVPSGYGLNPEAVRRVVAALRAAE